MSAEERALALEIGALVYANPFLEDRIALERRIVGTGYIESQPYWSLLPDVQRETNIAAIDARCGGLVEVLHARMRSGVVPSTTDRQIYDDLVIYFLYERYRDVMLDLIEERTRATFYSRFHSDVATYLSNRIGAAHLFACYYQVRRAFHLIFRNIVGRSKPAARLRAAAWQSIFTHDMRRYRRSLYARMADVATLITGPTGTGKELVARAIGYSRYIPFDDQSERFAGVPESSFIAINLSALSPTLIESELFGHKKGAFTGALSDRTGFLESCGAMGTVFLDEIGDVDPSIQVKLLRVLQSRAVQRLGETTPRRFEGKIIAATNRDLGAEIGRARFREDFYYRLCSDTIVTPSLQELLTGAKDGELQHLVQFICARVAGEDEAGPLADEVMCAIEVSPGLDYRWPGNFRELEQCVRSVMLRGSYQPGARREGDARQRIARSMLSGSFTADDLLRNYCTLLYASSRNYNEVAKKLQVDWRAVRAKVDEALLREL